MEFIYELSLRTVMKKFALSVAVLLVGAGGMVGCGDSGTKSIKESSSADEVAAYKAKMAAEAAEGEKEMTEDGGP